MDTTCKIYIEGSNPIYKGGDTLAGYLEVSTASDERFKVAVSFEGHTKIWLSFESLENHDHVVPTAEDRFLKETQLFKLDSIYLQFSHEKLVYHLPFEFTIPNQLPSHPDTPSEFLDLPPTLKEGSILQKKGVTYMQPLITYLIKASISSHIPTTTKTPLVICTEETEIVIEPVTQPSQFLDFENSASTTDKESLMSITKPIKRHPWSRPIGSLTITTEQPSPLNTSSPHLEASTTLPLILSFHPYHSIIPPNNSGPPSWTIDITTSIRTDAFFSVHKFTSIPTITSANKDLYTGFRSTCTAQENREFVEPEWRTWRECFCLDDRSLVMGDAQRQGECEKKGDGPCWTTILYVPVMASKGLEQGYVSRLAARRHSLVVRVKVRNYVHEVMEMEVPLEVVNCGVGVEGGEGVLEMIFVEENEGEGEGASVVGMRDGDTEVVEVVEIMEESDEGVGDRRGRGLFLPGMWLEGATVM